MQKQNPQAGFTLIELLLVVVIVGLLSVIAIPSLAKSRDSAEKASALTTMRMINMYQSGHFFRNNRFGNLQEINAVTNNTLGTTVSRTNMVRGSYSYYIFPPTNAGLKTRYTVVAMRFENGNAQFAFIMSQDGSVRTLLNDPSA